MTIQSNGLKISSTKDTSLTIDKDVYFEANALGNGDSGELWQELKLQQSEFKEEVFRMFLKSHFDMGSSGKTLLYSFLASCYLAGRLSAHLFILDISYTASRCFHEKCEINESMKLVDENDSKIPLRISHSDTAYRKSQ